MHAGGLKVGGSTVFVVWGLRWKGAPLRRAQRRDWVRCEDIVAGLEAGADDYLTKPFDHNELRARVEVGRRILKLQSALAARIKELQSALDHVKTLQGILPICMHCHKIRNDEESWERLEKYLTDHTGAMLSHGLCPDCLEKYYPEDSDEEENAESEIA